MEECKSSGDPAHRHGDPRPPGAHDATATCPTASPSSPFSSTEVQQWQPVEEINTDNRKFVELTSKIYSEGDNGDDDGGDDDGIGDSFLDLLEKEEVDDCREQKQIGTNLGISDTQAQFLANGRFWWAADKGRTLLGLPATGDDDPAEDAGSCPVAVANLDDAQKSLAIARKVLSGGGLSQSEQIVANGHVKELESYERIALSEAGLAKAREDLAASTGGDQERTDLGSVVESRLKDVEALRRRIAIETRDLRVLDDVFTVLAKEPSAAVADPVLLSCKMLAYYTETRALDALHRADDREVRAGMDEYWGEECTVKGVVTVFGAKALSRPRLCATVSKDEWVKDMEHCAQNLRQTGYTNGHAVCLRALSAELDAVSAHNARIPLCRPGTDVEGAAQLPFPIADDMFERRAAVKELAKAREVVAAAEKITDASAPVEPSYRRRHSAPSATHRATGPIQLGASLRVTRSNVIFNSVEKAMGETLEEAHKETAKTANEAGRLDQYLCKCPVCLKEDGAGQRIDPLSYIAHSLRALDPTPEEKARVDAMAALHAGSRALSEALSKAPANTRLALHPDIAAELSEAAKAWENAWPEAARVLACPGDAAAKALRATIAVTRQGDEDDKWTLWFFCPGCATECLPRKRSMAKIHMHADKCHPPAYMRCPQSPVCKTRFREKLYSPESLSTHLKDPRFTCTIQGLVAASLAATPGTLVALSEEDIRTMGDPRMLRPSVVGKKSLFFEATEVYFFSQHMWYGEDGKRVVQAGYSLDPAPTARVEAAQRDQSSTAVAPSPAPRGADNAAVAAARKGGGGGDKSGGESETSSAFAGGARAAAASSSSSSSSAAPAGSSSPRSVPLPAPSPAPRAGGGGTSFSVGVAGGGKRGVKRRVGTRNRPLTTTPPAAGAGRRSVSRSGSPRTPETPRSEGSRWSPLSSPSPPAWATPPSSDDFERTPPSRAKIKAAGKKKGRSRARSRSTPPATPPAASGAAGCGRDGGSRGAPNGGVLGKQQQQQQQPGRRRGSSAGAGAENEEPSGPPRSRASPSGVTGAAAFGGGGARGAASSATSERQQRGRSNPKVLADNKTRDSASARPGKGAAPLSPRASNERPRDRQRGANLPAGTCSEDAITVDDDAACYPGGADSCPGGGEKRSRGVGAPLSASPPSNPRKK